jgi:hypothetical protein
MKSNNNDKQEAGKTKTPNKNKDQTKVETETGQQEMENKPADLLTSEVGKEGKSNDDKDIRKINNNSNNVIDFSLIIRNLMMSRRCWRRNWKLRWTLPFPVLRPRTLYQLERLRKGEWGWFEARWESPGRETTH